MASSAGPSKPKRQRKSVVCSELSSNNEDELLFVCGSDEDFDHDFSDCDEESSSSSEDEENRPNNFPTVDIILRPEQRRFLPEPPTTQSSTSGSTSAWNITDNLQNLIFEKINAFSGHPAGVQPIDYFNFFFEYDFLQMICDETNAQAQRIFLSEHTREASRITEWKELTVEELKVFLGLLLHMGTISLSRIQDYWKTDRLFSIPIFREQMGRNRFLLIMRCLHFTSETESDDPVYKIRPVLEYFNKKMEDCYYPSKQLSLDESTVLWKGRLLFRQYINNKRHKYGVKLYILTEPDGLILRFRLYTGSKDAIVGGKDHAKKVVLNLLENNLNCGHSVFMDNFYNSYDLAHTLLEKKTYCTGTLRKNLKENPKEVINAKLKQGENISRFREGIHVGKWKDKRDVVYITSEYPDRMVTVANGRGQIKKKPEAIVKYNEFMSGIDRQDQLLSYYPCERMTLRWDLKIAIHTFQMLLINSYKIYNKFSGQPKIRFYDYRLSVIDELLTKKTTPVIVPKRLLKIPHVISRITDRLPNGRIRRKQCRQCSKNKIRTDSTWHCLACENQPGLCVECFDDFHNSLL